MTLKGLDYSWGRPNLDTVKSSGYSFVARYLAAYGGGKEITPWEANQIRARGLGIVLVYEQYVSRPKEGRAAGQADARTALAQARSIGFPDNRPIYFAVDWDTTEADQAAIDEYLRGCADILGAGRVGVYGSFYVVERCKKNGTAQWFWQTYAWSGGQVSPHTHFLQYLNGQVVGGAAVDFNESKKADFGAWGIGNTKPTPVPVPPTPKPSKGGTYTVKKDETLSGIAYKFGTTYQYLAKINNIANPNIIFEGQVLNITAKAAPQKTYTVVRGDSLSEIAAKYGTTAKAIGALNGIVNLDLIYSGQVLRIP